MKSWDIPQIRTSWGLARPLCLIHGNNNLLRVFLLPIDNSQFELHFIFSQQRAYAHIDKFDKAALIRDIWNFMNNSRAQTELSENAEDEVKKYKSALRKFFKCKNFVPVIFERNYKTSHMQLHVVPVPKNFSEGLKEVFLTFADDHGIELTELPSKAHLKDFAQPGSPYFYVELPTKEKLFSTCSKNFPIHFGRDVLASGSVLNKPDQVNWRNCIKSKEEEERMAQEFRSQFESFDIS